MSDMIDDLDRLNELLGASLLECEGMTRRPMDAARQATSHARAGPGAPTGDTAVRIEMAGCPGR